MVVRLSDICSKTGKNAFFVFSGCFWANLGQPYNHIGWATPMSFPSINPTKPRINPWNFHLKTLRIGGAGKWGFFLRCPFWISFFQKKKNLLSPNQNQSTFIG
jgi:hypothetical protein